MKCDRCNNTTYFGYRSEISYTIAYCQNCYGNVYYIPIYIPPKQWKKFCNLSKNLTNQDL